MDHDANEFDNYFPLRVNTKIMNASGDTFVVYEVTPSSTANTSAVKVRKIRSSASATVLASTDFVAEEFFTIQSDIVADGMTEFGDSVKAEFIDRYNYLEMAQKVQSWTRLELQKIKNLSQTNAMDYEWEEKMNQLRLDLFSMFIAGQRGEFLLADPITGSSANKRAKSMHGLYPQMVDGGASFASPTLAGLQSAF